MKRLLLALLIALAFLAPRRAAAEEATPETKPGDDKAHVHGIVAGGMSYGELFGTGIKATSIEAAMVADVAKHLGVSSGADVELGKTSVGQLSTTKVAPFLTIDGVFGRLRFGVGPELSYFHMSRTTSSNLPAIAAIGLGARGRVSFDLIRFDDDPAHHRSIFVAVSPDIEWLRGTTQMLDFTTGALAWRTNGTVGFRF